MEPVLRIVRTSVRNIRYMQALTERFELRLDQDTLQSVDAWRSRQTDMPSRAEAVRRLVERGLGASDDRPLRFSGGETLMIHMLCDLVDRAKPKSDINTRLVREALYGGHLWALEWDLRGIFHQHVDNPQAVRFVVDVLDMWHFIESAWKKLDPKDRARVESEAEPFGDDPKFRGFDGNNEAEYLGIARFLIEEMKRFSQFKGRDLDSHLPSSLESYDRMLTVFLPMRATLSGATLTASQIIEILKARRHPGYVGRGAT
jgi:uncharacterized protein